MPRWTELAVYRLPESHQYVVSKIGRSTVAHRPTCPRANARSMVTWLEAGDEGKVHRVPCTFCFPAVGNQMDPETLLERSRYTVLQARDYESLTRVLLQGRPGEAPVNATSIIGVTQEVVRQIRANDPGFDRWWRKFTDSDSH